MSKNKCSVCDGLGFYPTLNRDLECQPCKGTGRTDQLLKCPEPSCEGLNKIERLIEDEYPTTFSYGCSKCGGYFKAVSTYKKAILKYRRVCEFRKSLIEEFKK